MLLDRWPPSSSWPYGGIAHHHFHLRDVAAALCSDYFLSTRAESGSFERDLEKRTSSRSSNLWN
jgi:hypothetical protein